jgi:hypothetical protein
LDGFSRCSHGVLNNVRMAWWLSICTTSFRKKKGKWFKIENIVVEQRPESQADGFIKRLK